VSSAYTHENAEQHVRLLSIFYYVLAGLFAFFSCIPIIHFSMGLFMLLAPEKFEGDGEPPPQFVGWLFVIMAPIAMMLGWTFAACLALAGRYLAQHRRYVFILIVAGIACLNVPLGMVLGVFTFIVLSKPETKALFNPSSVDPT
jgi:hypothetical protein